MTSHFETKAQQEIWQILRDINSAWVEGRPEDLAKFFHEDMMIIPPDFRERDKGRDACVEGYKDFCSQATIHDFKELDPAVDVYGDTAVVTYRYEITYEMNGETHHDTGRDVFVLAREGNKWWAAWRMLLTD